MRHRRERKVSKSGDPAKKRYKWKYYDLLSFLEPFCAGAENV